MAPDRLLAELDRLHAAIVEESQKIDALTDRLDDFVTGEVVTDRVDELERREGRRRWRDRAAVLVLVLGLFTVNRAGVVDACHRDNRRASASTRLLLRAQAGSPHSPESDRFFRDSLRDFAPAPCHWMPRP